MSKKTQKSSKHLTLVPDPPSLTEEESNRKKVATQWLRRLRGLQEPSTRVNRLYLGFQENIHELGDLFEHILSHLHNSLCRTIYLDFVRLLSGARPVSYSMREIFYGEALERKLPILRVLSLQSQTDSGTDVPHPSLVADFASTDPELQEIALGRRKSLARTGDMDMVARLARDPDPRVIRILLDHPRLTEKDLIKIASRRPAAAMALAEVIHHARWGARAAAQEAVALNPYSPPGLAAALLPLLPSPVRRQLREGLQATPLVNAMSLALDGDTSLLNTLLSN